MIVATKAGETQKVTQDFPTVDWSAQVRGAVGKVGRKRKAWKAVNLLNPFMASPLQKMRPLNANLDSLVCFKVSLLSLPFSFTPPPHSDHFADGLP